MGDRVYYSCLMNFNELASRVHYASKVHENSAYSDMIQRALVKKRAVEIAKYLESQPERFFNSLVVATYGGDPNWHSLSNVKNKYSSESLNNLTEEIVESVGFLTLDGTEKLFAVDGQHRLAGIKNFLNSHSKDKIYDEVSVIFVAHEDSNDGLIRTRRLFTTLNKTARPVSKGGIIALDEDDVMAICVRRIVEKSIYFQGNRIAFVARNNLPVSNVTSLTTIGNLYDILCILFTIANSKLKDQKHSLQQIRPPENTLTEYYELALTFLREMKENFKELEDFFTSEDTTHVVKKYRGVHGGSALFRPVGLEIFTRIVAQLTQQKHMELTEAVKLSANLPTDLNDSPYVGLLWNSSTKTVINAHKVTLREILLHMIGASKKSENELISRYRIESGDTSAKLPNPVV